MPTYEYACTACAEHLEVVQSFAEDPLTDCPACGGPLRKVFSPIGVVFKGSGFYKTDSRPSGGAKSGTAASSGGEATSGGSTTTADKTDGSGKVGDKADGAGKAGTKADGAGAAKTGGGADKASTGSVAAAS